MDVDGELALVAAEEALPERREREGAASGEEHEGHLGHALERVRGGHRHHGGAPEELLVRHVVHELRRGHERREAAGAVVAVRVHGGREDDVVVGHVVLGARPGGRPEAGDDADGEDDEEHDPPGDAGGLLPREHTLEVVDDPAALLHCSACRLSRRNATRRERTKPYAAKPELLLLDINDEGDRSIYRPI
jgi:hypothetical protein